MFNREKRENRGSKVQPKNPPVEQTGQRNVRGSAIDVLKTRGEEAAFKAQLQQALLQGRATSRDQQTESVTSAIQDKENQDANAELLLEVLIEEGRMTDVQALAVAVNDIYSWFNYGVRPSSPTEVMALGKLSYRLDPQRGNLRGGALLNPIRFLASKPWIERRLELAVAKATRLNPRQLLHAWKLLLAEMERKPGFFPIAVTTALATVLAANEHLLISEVNHIAQSTLVSSPHDQEQSSINPVQQLITALAQSTSPQPNSATPQNIKSLVDYLSDLKLSTDIPVALAALISPDPTDRRGNVLKRVAPLLQPTTQAATNNAELGLHLLTLLDLVTLYLSHPSSELWARIETLMDDQRMSDVLADHLKTATQIATFQPSLTLPDGYVNIPTAAKFKPTEARRVSLPRLVQDQVCSPATTAFIKATISLLPPDAFSAVYAKVFGSNTTDSSPSVFLEGLDPQALTILKKSWKCATTDKRTLLPNQTGDQHTKKYRREPATLVPDLVGEPGFVHVLATVDDAADALVEKDQQGQIVTQVHHCLLAASQPYAQKVQNGLNDALSQLKSASMDSVPLMLAMIAHSAQEHAHLYPHAKSNPYMAALTGIIADNLPLYVAEEQEQQKPDPSSTNAPPITDKDFGTYNYELLKHTLRRLPIAQALAVVEDLFKILNTKERFALLLHDKIIALLIGINERIQQSDQPTAQKKAQLEGIAEIACGWATMLAVATTLSKSTIVDGKKNTEAVITVPEAQNALTKLLGLLPLNERDIPFSADPLSIDMSGKGEVSTDSLSGKLIALRTGPRTPLTALSQKPQPVLNNMTVAQILGLENQHTWSRVEAYTLLVRALLTPPVDRIIAVTREYQSKAEELQARQQALAALQNISSGNAAYTSNRTASVLTEIGELESSKTTARAQYDEALAEFRKRKDILTDVAQRLNIAVVIPDPVALHQKTSSNGIMVTIGQPPNPTKLNRPGFFASLSEVELAEFLKIRQILDEAPWLALLINENS